MALAWVTLTCLYDKFKLVNYVLSARFWLPLSRLTYCAYLVHPIVLGTFFGAFRQPLHYNLSMAISFYFNTLFLSYLSALAIALVVEFPFVSLDKLVLGGH